MMGDTVRFDTVTLASNNLSDQFAAFVQDTLFPVMKAAYGHLTRKTIAALEEQALLREGSEGIQYVWISSWSGPLEAVSDRDFRKVFMGENEDVKAALGTLESFGRREEPRVYQKLT
jgi:hypothetical protein